ncbi:MAG: hypothetical protein M3081_02990 [Gemmatimonadota bacterium]|nr:hypothetical protein [Gemmatimonadota bacterium]
MTSPTIVQLFSKLSHDSDAEMRRIGQRCMRDYDEFSGMKYARLTALDEERVVAAAKAARAGDDRLRAGLLEAAASMIHKSRAS